MNEADLGLLGEICEKLHMGLFQVDEKENLLFANQVMAVMLGMNGRKVSAASNRVLRDLLTCSLTLSVYRHEENERSFWIQQIQGDLVDNGAGRFFLVQDVTEQEQLRKGLHETNFYRSILEQILENAYEGVVVTDADGKIMMLNNAYANYLEINRQDAIGQHVTKVIDNTRVHTVIETGIPEFG